MPRKIWRFTRHITRTQLIEIFILGVIALPLAAYIGTQSNNATWSGVYIALFATGLAYVLGEFQRGEAAERAWRGRLKALKTEIGMNDQEIHITIDLRQAEILTAKPGVFKTENLLTTDSWRAILAAGDLDTLSDELRVELQRLYSDYDTINSSSRLVMYATDHSQSQYDKLRNEIEPNALKLAVSVLAKLEATASP